jgi:hypothetical protein
VIEESACVNFSKSNGIFSAGMPIPVVPGNFNLSEIIRFAEVLTG